MVGDIKDLRKYHLSQAKRTKKLKILKQKTAIMNA